MVPAPSQKQERVASERGRERVLRSFGVWDRVSLSNSVDYLLESANRPSDHSTEPLLIPSTANTISGKRLERQGGREIAIFLQIVGKNRDTSRRGKKPQKP